MVLKKPDHCDRPPQEGWSLRIDEALAALAMALLCLISFANVVVRYLTNISFAFTEEFSVFLMVFMTLVGTALAFARDGHIRIVFLRDRLPGRLKSAADALALILSALLFVLVLYYGGVFAYEEWLYEETSPSLGYPNWIYTVWLPVLSGLVLARIACRLRALFKSGGR